MVFRSKLWSSQIWSELEVGEGDSGTLRFGLSDNFHLGGGYSRTLGFGLSDNFHFGGGYSGTLGFSLSDNFHWGGGCILYQVTTE